MNTGEWMMNKPKLNKYNRSLLFMMMAIPLLFLSCDQSYLFDSDAHSGTDVLSYLLAPLSTMPANVTATDGQIGKIVIAWNRDKNANGYKIFRSDSLEGTYSLIAELSDQVSYEDFEISFEGDKNSSIFYYRICSITQGILNEIVEGPMTFPVEGYASPISADPSTVSSFTLTAGIIRGIWKGNSLSWESESTESLWMILQAEDNGTGEPGDFSFISNSDGSPKVYATKQAIVFPETVGITTFYKVATCKRDPLTGDILPGTPSDAISGLIPPVVTGLVVTQGIGDTPELLLTWDVIDSCDSILVKRRESLDDDPVLFEISNPAEISFLDSESGDNGIVGGTNYFYSVAKLFTLLIDELPVQVQSLECSIQQAMFFKPPEAIGLLPAEYQPIIIDPFDSVTLQWKIPIQDTPTLNCNIYTSNVIEGPYRTVALEIEGTYNATTQIYSHSVNELDAGYHYFRIYNVSEDEIENSRSLQLSTWIRPEPIMPTATKGLSETVTVSWDHPNDDGITGYQVYRKLTTYGFSKSHYDYNDDLINNNNDYTTESIVINETEESAIIDSSFELVETLLDDGSSSYSFIDSKENTKALRPGLYKYYISALTTDIELNWNPRPVPAFDYGYRQITNREFIQEANKYLDFSIRTLHNGDNNSEIDQYAYTLTQKDKDDFIIGEFFYDTVDTSSSNYDRQMLYCFTEFNTGYLTFNTTKWDVPSDLRSACDGNEYLRDDWGNDNGTLWGGTSTNDKRIGILNITGIYSGTLEYNLARLYTTATNYSHNGDKTGARDKAGAAPYSKHLFLWDVSDYNNDTPDQGFYLVRQKNSMGEWLKDEEKVYWEEGMSVTHEDGETAYNNAASQQALIVEPDYSSSSHYPVWPEPVNP